MATISIQKIQSIKNFTSKLMLKANKSNVHSKGVESDLLNETLANKAASILNFKLDIRAKSFENLNEQYGSLSLSLNQFKDVNLENNDEFISSLSQDEAKLMVSEDGYYGVKNTSKRIADFVIKGGGTDVERLKAGRAGVLHGFKASEKAFGGQLPDISYSTLKSALEQIDTAIEEAGGQVVDIAI